MRSLLLATCVLAACKGAPPPAPPPSDDEAVRNAAEQFLRCYERDGAECRSDDAPVKEWSAMGALALVRDGIPTEIYDELPQMLHNLRDETYLRRQFIQTLTQHHGWARTGQCEVRRIDVVGPRALALAKAAAARAERLGMDGTEAGDTVRTLAESVQVVAGARVVHTNCAATRSSFYLIFVQNQNQAWRPVGFYPAPPTWFRSLEGQPSPPPTNRVRIEAASPNVIDPWLPIYEEHL